MRSIFTIVSKNYLHYARSLLQSARQFHPNAHLYCFLVDQADSLATAFSRDFTTVPLSLLNIENQQTFIFQYTILELNTAIKPWCFDFLFSKGYETVTYIDPDILIYRHLSEIESAFSAGFDIILTPHLLAPINDSLSPSELDIKRTGTYNLGFLSLRNCKNSHALLAWWKKKLYNECVVELERGLFVDQGWMDLVPGLFANTMILRHAGYNVAYWNIGQRNFSKKNDNIYVNGELLAFFHYSGFDYKYPQRFSKHQNRFTFSNLNPILVSLALSFADLLAKNGASEYSALKYDFGFFKDGIVLPDVVRLLYRKNLQVREMFGDNPYENSNVLNQPVAPGDLLLRNATVAMYALWDARSDLKHAFPLDSKINLSRYRQWFIDSGADYFSNATISAHLNSMSSAKVEVVRKQLAPALVVTSTVAHQHLHDIYKSALARLPDPSGYVTYLDACRTFWGRASVRRAILASPESRAAPHHFYRRLISFFSLLASLRGERGVPISCSPDTEQPDSTPLQPLDVLLACTEPSGFYTFDADRRIAGLWANDLTRIPLPALQAGAKISVEGTSSIHYLATPDDFAPQLLTFALNGVTFFTQPLGSDVSFSVSAPIPTSVTLGDCLSISSSSFFIPASVMPSNDERKLAWRCQKVTADALSLIDCSLENPYPCLEIISRVSGINIVGYVTSEHGVGQVSRALAQSLKASDIPYTAVDIGYQVDTPKQNTEIYKHADGGDCPIDIICANADQAANTVAYLSKHPRKILARVGFWHWEQVDFPQSMMDAFKYFDEIWVPSGFVQDSISRSSPIPVFKLPHAVELPPLVPRRSRSHFNLPESGFLALITYDFDSYQYRKNPLAAINAFRLATENRLNCGLVIKTTNANKHPHDAETLRLALQFIPSSYIIDDFLSADDALSLKQATDCLISLHRAEGFGLNIAEMMALGKPVVATAWSGNMEFMTPFNSLPVKYTLNPLKEQLGPYQAGSPWAEPDVHHAAQQIAMIIDDPHIRMTLGERARQDIGTYLSPVRIGNLAKARLMQLQQRRLRAR